MTSEQFAYWLQGFTELNPSMEQPTCEQWKSITEHLKTVFVKVTPPVKAAPVSIEEALRQHREAEQRGQHPYGPFGPKYSMFGEPLQITC